MEFPEGKRVERGFCGVVGIKALSRGENDLTVAGGTGVGDFYIITDT
jgi:hypothetical protein